MITLKTKDFYVIIVVTPVQYAISEDIRKEGCNVSEQLSGIPEQRRHKPRPGAGVIHAGVQGVPEVGPR